MADIVSRDKTSGYDISSTKGADTDKRSLDINIESQKDYTVRVDTVSTTYYIGRALVGSSESSSVWQVKKIVDSSGDITITYADGNANYDNVWDNRLSLSYS